MKKLEEQFFKKKCNSIFKLPQICFCEYCNYQQKFEQDSDKNKKFSLNLEIVRKSILKDQKVFIKKKLGFINGNTPQLNFISILQSISQKKEHYFILNIPEIVVFRNDKIFVYSQQDNGVKIIEQNWQGILKVIKRLENKTEYDLIWRDGTQEAVSNNELMSLLKSYKGETSEKIVKIYYFHRTIRGKLQNFHFDLTDIKDQKLFKRAELEIKIMNKEITNLNLQYHTFEQEYQFIQNLQQQNLYKYMQYFAYKIYFYCQYFNYASIDKFDCQFEIEDGVIYLTDIKNIHQINVKISHMGERIPPEQILLKMQKFQIDILNQNQKNNEELQQIIRKLISENLYQQYDSIRYKISLSTKITQPHDCFNQELFHKLHPQCSVKLTDLLTYDLNTIREIIATEFKCLYKKVHKIQNNFEPQSISLNKLCTNSNRMGNTNSFDVGNKFSQRLQKIETEMRFTQNLTRLKPLTERQFQINSFHKRQQTISTREESVSQN